MHEVYNMAAQTFLFRREVGNIASMQRGLFVWGGKRLKIVEPTLE
jgi:hypothetical protein